MYPKHFYILLNYFRFNTDDLLDIDMFIRINNSELIKLNKYYYDGLYELEMDGNYYFNSYLSMIETIPSDKNFKLDDLLIPISESIIVEFIITGEIEGNLSVNFIPSMKVFGNCEEAMFCFIKK